MDGSVTTDKWGDLMDIYEDPEFLEFPEKRYSALLDTVKKAIKSVFESVSIEQQIRLVAALLASNPPVYIKKDFLDLKTRGEIKLTEEKLREILGGDFDLFYLTSIRLKKALIPKRYLGEQKWNVNYSQLLQGTFHQRLSIMHRTTQNLITRTKEPVYRDSSSGKLGRKA